MYHMTLHMVSKFHCRFNCIMTVKAVSSSSSSSCLQMRRDNNNNAFDLWAPFKPLKVTWITWQSWISWGNVFQWWGADPTQRWTHRQQEWTGMWQRMAWEYGRVCSGAEVQWVERARLRTGVDHGEGRHSNRVGMQLRAAIWGGQEFTRSVCVVWGRGTNNH